MLCVHNGVNEFFISFKRGVSPLFSLTTEKQYHTMNSYITYLPFKELQQLYVYSPKCQKVYDHSEPYAYYNQLANQATWLQIFL